MTKAAVTPKPGILEIEPYVPGKSQAQGARIFKLSSNEAPFGPPEAAGEAFLAATSSFALYPDGSAMALRQALAGRYALNAANIVCGAGSDEILQLLGHAYIAEGDEVIYSQHGFMVYPIIIRSNSGKPVIVKEKDYRTDVDAMLRAITPRTKMIFLANPNNPTGTYLPIDEVRRLHAGLPRNVLLVLDAAYAEYVRRNDYEAGLELVATHENVVMTRTFSKIFGLAGLRLGWCYAPLAIADVLNRIRGPFNVSNAAQATGIAALKDHAFLERSIAHNEKWLAELSNALSRLGIKVTPSVGNFLLLHFPGGEKSAAQADAFLLSRGLILRRLESYGLPDALRLTVGSDEANLAVISALSEFMQ